MGEVLEFGKRKSENQEVDRARRLYEDANEVYDSNDDPLIRRMLSRLVLEPLSLVLRSARYFSIRTIRALIAGASIAFSRIKFLLRR